MTLEIAEMSPTQSPLLLPTTSLSLASTTPSMQRTIYTADTLSTAIRRLTFYSPSNILITSQSGNLERVQSFTLGESFAISSKTVNSFHATLLRRRNNRGYASNDINAATLGIDLYQAVPNGLQVTVGKFNVGGGTNSIATYNDNALAIDDDVTKLLGKHQIAFGETESKINSTLRTRTNPTAPLPLMANTAAVGGTEAPSLGTRTWTF